MRQIGRRKICSGLHSQSFKPVAKLGDRLLSRFGAIAAGCHRHGGIDRHHAGIGIEAEREKQTNKEDRQELGRMPHDVYCNPWRLSVQERPKFCFGQFLKKRIARHS